MLTVVPDCFESAAQEAGGPSVSLLDELVRESARRMLAAALEAEVAEYIDAHTDDVDETGCSPPSAGRSSPMAEGPGTRCWTPC